MFTRYYWKNKLYKLSNRDYLFDYSKIESKEIDMTLSGRYLSSYPNIQIPISEFDKYPLLTNIKELEDLIKTKILTSSEIIIGSGANGLLQNIIKILFKNKGNLITSFYSFDQAEYAVTSFDGVTKRIYTNKYDLDLDNVVKAIDKKTKMIYICNPNNPTGKFIKSKDLIELSKKVRIPLVVDESGIEFTGKKGILELIKKLPKNLFIIRSFSKAYGLANLRIGYLACSKEFKQIYLKNITTNEYSGISCLIAKNILSSSEKYMKQNINQILKEKTKMINQLEKIGIYTVESYSNTIFTKTVFDNKFIKELEKNNISVVPIYDRNNNLHIRIAIQDKETNLIFIKKLSQIMKNKELIVGKEEDGGDI